MPRRVKTSLGPENLTRLCALLPASTPHVPRGEKSADWRVFDTAGALRGSPGVPESHGAAPTIMHRQEWDRNGGRDVRSALSRDTGSVNDPPGLICWQRTVEEVKGLGAAGWGGSRQLEPAPSHRKKFFRLLSGARACIPGAVRPVHGDTAESLKSRLSTSDFLDDIHILKGGKGPGRVRLNATSYPQPRRVTWSVLADIDRDTGAHGLYAYTQGWWC